MAIFDSEKRPRGLRVPSLSAMKNGAAKSQFSFSRKSEVKTTEEELPIPVVVPSLPPQQAPPTKELPPPPKDQVPPPPRMLTKVPPRRKVANGAPNGNAQPVTVPVPQSQSESQAQSPPATPQAASPQSQVHAPLALVRPEQPVQSKPQHQASPQNVPPVTLSPPASDNEDLTPLEDFIPTPEGPGTPLEYLSSEEVSVPPMPDVEPTAAPLSQVHFACFQGHRNMPVAQNLWCPLPCQTCHKVNQEIRHRCVFCCLRVCEGCYQALQKCKNRSLDELMEKIG